MGTRVSWQGQRIKLGRLTFVPLALGVLTSAMPTVAGSDDVIFHDSFAVPTIGEVPTHFQAEIWAAMEGYDWSDEIASSRDGRVGMYVTFQGVILTDQSRATLEDCPGGGTSARDDEADIDVAGKFDGQEPFANAPSLQGEDKLAVRQWFEGCIQGQPEITYDGASEEGTYLPPINDSEDYQLAYMRLGEVSSVGEPPDIGGVFRREGDLEFVSAFAAEEYSEQSAILRFCWGCPAGDLAELGQTSDMFLNTGQANWNLRDTDVFSSEMGHGPDSPVILIAEQIGDTTQAEVTINGRSSGFHKQQPECSFDIEVSTDAPVIFEDYGYMGGFFDPDRSRNAVNGTFDLTVEGVQHTVEYIDGDAFVDGEPVSQAAIDCAILWQETLIGS